MLAQRLIVAIIIIPMTVIFVSLGGWVMAIFLAVALGYAAWEYWQMFSGGGYNPSAFLLIAGTASLILVRKAFSFNGSEAMISLLILLTMTWQIVQFERGCQTAAVDLGITLGGILYLGWLGAYLVSLREFADGMWWLLIVIPTVSIADGGAYFIGRKFGRHKISQRVSPNKSWEGYIGGVVFGTLGAMLLASLWHYRAPIITVDKALILGLAITILSPIGDMGESMLKRNFNVKDSSHVLPGHGGIMDRIDSWLWAAPIGFYIIFALWR